jgi:hypothetical protein
MDINAAGVSLPWYRTLNREQVAGADRLELCVAV